MNANEILFRCSSLGYLMPGPREKAGELQETTKNHLIDVFISTKYKRREDVENKFIEKGNIREEDSITLLSRINKKFYKKNLLHLHNDYISGTPDIIVGEIGEAEETRDTKTSYSIYTFFRSQKELNKNYELQGHGYMALTGAKKHSVDFCLVNGTATAIANEKRWLSYKYGENFKSDQSYIEKAKQIEINHIFDLHAFMQENPDFEFDNYISEWNFDIPISERHFSFTIERNEQLIQDIYKRIEVCRQWMNANLFKVPQLKSEAA